jgi:hypothetical protein
MNKIGPKIDNFFEPKKNEKKKKTFKFAVKKVKLIRKDGNSVIKQPVRSLR